MKSSAFRSNGRSGMKLGLLASTSLATRHLMLFARETARSKADVSDEHFRTSGKSSRRVPGLLWSVSVLSAFVTGSAFADEVIDGETVTVPGMHSSPWIIDGNLVVGFDGNGTLEITTGGIVSNNVGYIGRVAGSNGLVTVSGAGSQWNNASSLYVGDNGKGTLNITAGGVVSNAESAIIGIYAGSTGMVTISGTGSQWYVATASTEARQYGFIVGHYGNGTLEISDGGLVSNAVGYVGHNFGSTGKVTVSGAGSQWSNSFELYVGIIGSGALNITDGGAVSSAGGYISYGADSTGTATVSGGGSRWTNSFDLYVGQAGNGKLKITDGGVVSGEIGYIGGLAGGTGTVAVSGAGSQWSSFDDVYVGFEGSGTLTIQTGGAVSASGLFIAYDASSTGIVNIGGAGSEAAAGVGTLDAPSVTFGAGNGTLNFNHIDTTGDYLFAAAMSGAGTINHLAGVTTLGGASGGFSGATDVSGGTLLVDGTLGGTVAVEDDASLGGTGTLGAVSIADGGTLLGRQGETLTMGSLTLEQCLQCQCRPWRAGHAGAVQRHRRPDARRHPQCRGPRRLRRAASTGFSIMAVC